MDFCRNVPEPLAFQSEYQPEPDKPGGLSTSLDDLFPSENPESDVNLEWLSIFVEDCLSSSGNCIPPPPNDLHLQHNSSPVPSKPCLDKTHQNPPPKLQDFAVPAKPRTKRKRAPAPTTLLTSLSHHLHPQAQITSDPPLLHQAYWLADSELIVPKKENKYSTSSIEEDEEDEGDEEEEEIGSKVVEVDGGVMKENSASSGSSDWGNGQARRCTHCLAQRTPQWRAGPLGPKTLCNACGVRFKSGRLLPEYRPAKSPTFVSYKHSNSHKKVMEMRMSILSSVPTE